MPPGVLECQILCYLWTPCILHQLLQLQQTTKNMKKDSGEYNPVHKEDIQMEYPSD
jgi:hypothetical protein